MFYINSDVELNLKEVVLYNIFFSIKKNVVQVDFIK